MPSAAVIDTASALRDTVSGWRRAGQSIALVPTMRNLHDGHFSLVRLARQEADRVIVSIFAGPADRASDPEAAATHEMIEEAGSKLLGRADALFAPALEEMYSPGDCTRVAQSGPTSAGLEDRYNAAHFESAATIAAKLLNLTQADIAVYGEKDYQELLVVRRMVADLHMPVRILSAPTLREKGGLALAARNRKLSPQNRAHAAILYQTLASCAEGIREGDAVSDVLEAGWAVLTKAGFRIDYFEAREAETLALPSPSSKSLRLLVAARLGTTRLIDNIEV